MPLVSVIIPSYNRAHLITETINSVLRQSFRDFEIIVVDDGSKDNTCEVVSLFPVKYIRQENQGLPNARNTGIKAAGGKYIAILDSDDCLLERSLERRVEALEPYPQAAFIYSQVYFMDVGGRTIGIGKPPFKKSGFRDGKKELHDLMYANHVPASSVMMRYSCLDKVGMFNPTFIHGQEDLEMWVRLSSVYDSVYIAEPLVKLRIHNNRMTHQLASSAFEKNHRMIIESVFDNPALSPLFLAERNKIYSHFNYFMADVAYMRRSMPDVRRYLARSFTLYPQGLFSGLGLKWLYIFGKSLVPRNLVEATRRKRRPVEKAASASPQNSPS